MRPARIAAVLLPAVATPVAITGGAGAFSSTTTVTPKGCIDDNDPPDGPDACAESTNALDEANSVAVSPDGKSVYAASNGDDAIARFARSAATGALTPAGCVHDNDTARTAVARAPMGSVSLARSR